MSMTPFISLAEKLESSAEMDSIQVEQGHSVLLLWFGQDPAESMKDTVNRLLQKVGESGKVQVEHAERLVTCELLLLLL